MVDGNGTGIGFHREPLSDKAMRDAVAIAIELEAENFVGQNGVSREVFCDNLLPGNRDLRAQLAPPARPSAPAARRSQAEQRYLDFVDALCAADAAEGCLRGVADSDRVLSRQINELLELIRQYRPNALAGAVAKAYAARAFDADYIANILRQQQAERRLQPPLCLRDPRLNESATDPLSLLAYDAFILESGKGSDDSARETGSAEPVDGEPPSGDDDL